jgi:hypothetical protein
MRKLLSKQWPLLSVYALSAISMLLVVFVDFRAGAVLFALSVLWAFVLRLVLSDKAAGLLRVRRRRIDLTVLLTLGITLLVLALVVPHRNI